MNINSVIILRILQALWVTVALKLKQETPFSCFAFILQKGTHKFFYSLFFIFLHGPEKILLHTINFIKTVKRSKRPPIDY